MRAFVARAVAVVEESDLNAFVVVLAEHSDGSGQRLELQRSIEFDEQDEELGMATYCLCTEAGASHYGGVLDWSIKNRKLTVRLDEEASEELGVEEGFIVEAVDPRASEEDVMEGLKRIFAEDGKPTRT